LLAGWLGDSSPITILDLSGIPPTIQSELVGSVLRIVYDALFWARNIPEGGRERPLLIVLEEAHSYLDPKQTASVAVRKIAKEGRKYGIGMMLVS
jgi:DNA helicase HerA-like ATPase